jgi:hypothetical protein
MRALLLPALLSACVAGDEPDEVAVVSSAVTSSFDREHVVDDIYHYELVVRVGDEPNAGVRIHRVVREVAPFVARRTPHAVMMLHGDFSTFETNFLVGMAPDFARRGFDVWGVDRRWTLPAADGDISDFAGMTVSQAIDDVRTALGVARALRAVTGHGSGRLGLVGFSHGGQLAYAVAAVEANRPAYQRHVDAIVPLDWWGAYGPDQEFDRQLACEFAAFEYQLVADGETDFPADFQIAIGQLARIAPDDPSPIFPGETNRGALLELAGQTYEIAPFTPLYHWHAPILDGDDVIGLRESSEAAVAAWLEHAAPHYALIETADFDQLLCGEDSPIDGELSDIEIPLLYVGAAGAVGELGTHATTVVSSTDVSTLIVSRFGPEQQAEDFGHTDLLLATDAPALVWQPIAAWLMQH